MYPRKSQSQWSLLEFKTPKFSQEALCQTLKVPARGADDNYRVLLDPEEASPLDRWIVARKIRDSRRLTDAWSTCAGCVPKAYTGSHDETRRRLQLILLSARLH
jgi:hypothetical protein